MKCVHYSQIKGNNVQGEGIKDVNMRVAIGPDDGAPNFNMRVFTVKPGGHTPHHAHDFEHEVIVHSGSGEVLFDQTPNPITLGTIVFVPPNKVHQFKNNGNKDLVFVCVVPKGI